MEANLTRGPRDGIHSLCERYWYRYSFETVRQAKTAGGASSLVHSSVCGRFPALCCFPSLSPLPMLLSSFLINSHPPRSCFAVQQVGLDSPCPVPPSSMCVAPAHRTALFLILFLRSLLAIRHRLLEASSFSFLQRCSSSLHRFSMRSFCPSPCASRHRLSRYLLSNLSLPPCRPWCSSTSLLVWSMAFTLYVPCRTMSCNHTPTHASPIVFVPRRCVPSILYASFLRTTINVESRGSLYRDHPLPLDRKSVV